MIFHEMYVKRVCNAQAFHSTSHFCVLLKFQSVTMNLVMPIIVTIGIVSAAGSVVADNVVHKWSLTICDSNVG